jgi:hypothetical protein
MKQQFDPTKPVQTRAGLRAGIYSTDNGGDYPIHGWHEDGGERHVTAWAADGLYCFGAKGNVDLINIPVKTYWSKPEDIPADARWFMDYDGDCAAIQLVTSWGFILAEDVRIRFEELQSWVWSDRPFSKFEDGKECLVEEVQP